MGVPTGACACSPKAVPTASTRRAGRWRASWRRSTGRTRSASSFASIALGAAARTENGIEYGDLVKHMDFDFVAETAVAVQKTLSEMANAPAPPARVTLGGAVTDSAKILLEGHKDPERADYEILWRETTEARWNVLRLSLIHI